MDKVIGFTEDEIIVLEYNPKTDYFAMSGTTYSAYTTTEEQLEENMRDLLDECELWENAVANGSTEMGKEEWIDHVIRVDGCLNDDVIEIYVGREGNKQFKYLEFSSGGQIDLPDYKDFLVTYIDKVDYDFIRDVWKGISVNKGLHLIKRAWISDYVLIRVDNIMGGGFDIDEFTYLNSSKDCPQGIGLAFEAIKRFTGGLID